METGGRAGQACLAMRIIVLWSFCHGISRDEDAGWVKQETDKLRAVDGIADVRLRHVESAALRHPRVCSRLIGFAIGVFVVALGIIASEKLHRTTIALAGAVLIVATQTIEQQQAIESIDFNTIGLLAGMMLIASREPTSSARSPNGWADTGRFAARCDGVTEETR